MLAPPVTSHAARLSNPSSSASLAKLLLERLLIDSICPHSLEEAGLKWLSHASLWSKQPHRHYLQGMGRPDRWALAFPLGCREGSLPKLPEGGLLKG